MANTYKGYGLTPQGDAVPYSGGSAPASVLEAENAQKLGGVPAGDYALKTEVAANKAELEALKSGVEIVKTENGSMIAVNDAAERTMRGMTIYGKTEQKRYSGKNLLPNFRQDTEVYNGITFTNNEDGTFEANGTATAYAQFVDSASFILNPGTYVLSISGGVGGWAQLRSADGLTTYGDSNTGAFTIESETEVKFRFVVSKGVTLSGQYLPQLELSSTATSYEPYVGGIPSPNPDYPQELNIAGGEGEIKTVVCGKNMLNLLEAYEVEDPSDISVVSENAITLSSNLNTAWLSIRMYFMLPAGKYILSAKMESSSENASLNVYCVNKQFEVASRKYLADFTVTGSVSFELPTDMLLEIRPHVTLSTGTGGKTWTARYYDIQLERAQTASTYEPYRGHAVTLSTPNGLPGIPVTSGGNYTDESGQQWICDEVDLERGAYVKRVKPFSLSEVSVWNQWEDDWYNHDYLKDSVATTNEIIGMSSHVGSSNVINSNWLIHSHVIDKQRIGIQIRGIRTYWGFTGSTAEEFKAFIDSKNVKIVYACVPTEIPLTPEELAAYRALHTCYSNTIIYNDAGADMTVRYVADTKLYLDNKISEINEQNMAMSAALLGF